MSAASRRRLRRVVQGLRQPDWYGKPAGGYHTEVAGREADRAAQEGKVAKMATSKVAQVEAPTQEVEPTSPVQSSEVNEVGKVLGAESSGSGLLPSARIFESLKHPLAGEGEDK